MDLQQFADQLEEREVIELAYSEDLAWCQRKLLGRISVMIECEKQMIPWVYMHLRSRLKQKNILMEYLDGRRPPEGEQENRSASVLRIMIQQITWHVRNTTEDKVLVLPHLDLLTSAATESLTTEAREILPLLYENPRVVFLTFKDPNFQMFKAIENLFVAKRKILGIDRRVLPSLITRNEARKFPQNFPILRLYQYLSGCNALRVRQILSRLEGVDFPASEEDVIRQLRELTIQDGMELPNVDLEADLAGYTSVKKKLNSEILSLLKYKESLTDEKESRRLENLLPKGMIFFGPPGTGKTLFAKAMATALNATIQIVSGPELKSMWVGQSEENIRKVFFKARQSAPSIIVFDELDSFASARSTQGSNQVQHSMVNQLLTEMDGFRKEELVFVIGTTNFAESLDPALLRPGRFELKMEIPWPDDEDRFAILSLYNQKMSLNLSSEDLVWLAQKTGEMRDISTGTRFSGDHLNAVCRYLKRWSIREKKHSFSREELLLALRGGQVKLGLTDHERKVVAYHEAGHALVALSLRDAAPVERISVDSDYTDFLGYVQHAQREDKHVITKKQMLAELVILMGGREAELLMFEDISSGSENDVLRASRLAWDMVCRWGMSEGFGVRVLEDEQELSEPMAQKRDEAIDTMLTQARNHAKKILAARRDHVKLLGETLIQKKVLQRSDIIKLLGEE